VFLFQLITQRITLELNKSESLKLIHKRLAILTASLSDLDAAVAAETALAVDVAALKVEETALIAKDSTKPAELVQHRAKTDLLVGKLGRLHRQVELAEEKAIFDADAAGVLIYAFKTAAAKAYFDEVEARSARFFDRQDIPMLKSFAARGEYAKTILNHAEPHFSPRTPSHRSSDLIQARNLANAFSQLEDAAKDLDLVTDLPPQWLE
jgi:hypothetical protein